jgi:hypothetical protein
LAGIAKNWSFGENIIMKKILTGCAWLLIIAAFAQPKTPSGKPLKLELQSDEGTNGCAVVWNPEKKLYYTVIAGNVDFPIDVFSETGNWISTHESGVDNRGLWYNTKSGKLVARSYDGQLYSYSLKENGKPSEPVQIKDEVGPADQNVGTFLKGSVYYYSDGVINSISSKGKQKALQLAMSSDSENYNHYSMGVTGVKNYEFVVWNVTNSSLEFYNLKGKQTATVTLSGEIPEAENFRFSFANNRAWLYDVDSRTWTGYKVF